jgi:hypothetical protein
MSSTCPQCNENYERIATHWSLSSSCEHPELTNTQLEIITGCLMGDGWIDKNGKNPRLRVSMISQNYLKYLDDKFGILGNGVSLKLTARESAKQCRDSGFSKNAKAKNYENIYTWGSIKHPQLKKFLSWYTENGKIWPENIELTPKTLKHWYCGDGNWCNSKRKNYISISMANEAENTNKVDNIFKNSGLPLPSNYTIYEDEDGNKNCQAQFTTEDSKELWEYMGKPLPDFEYKWPDQNS